jgi:hypothetical protein
LDISRWRFLDKYHLRIGWIEGAMLKLPWKKPKVYEIATSFADGQEITYNFTRPLTAERAQDEFRKARAIGLPSGSVIIVN